MESIVDRGYGRTPHYDNGTYVIELIPQYCNLFGMISYSMEAAQSYFSQVLRKV